MEKTTNVRITKAMRFEDVKALLNGETAIYGTTIEDAMQFIDHEIGLLTRKSNGDKKPSKTQLENERYQKIIIDFLTDLDEEEKVTCTDLIKTIPELEGFTTQKVSPMMRKLVASGKVIKTEAKGKSLFSLV